MGKIAKCQITCKSCGEPIAPGQVAFENEQSGVSDICECYYVAFKD